MKREDNMNGNFPNLIDEIADKLINQITIRHIDIGRIFKVNGIKDEIRISKVNSALETASFLLNGKEVWVGFKDLIGSQITTETFAYFKNIKYEEGKVLLLARKGKPFLTLKLKEDGYYYFVFSENENNKNEDSYKIKFWYAHQMQAFYRSHKNYELI